LSVEVRSLTRTYAGSRGAPDVQALNGIDLEVGQGEFFGVLGPNGAGKTTLIRILSTLLTPSTGSASVAGLDVVKRAGDVRRSIGVVFGGERGLYDRLSARDNLRFAAELYGVPRSVQRSRIPALLERVDLADHAGSRVETFSRGMKQRLHIARALLHEPRVLFLDEPSSGLDPVAARSLRGLARELNQSGVTVLLTTHYMYEADELCDRVAVIAKGEVLVSATPGEVKNMVQLGRVLEVEAFGDLSGELDAVRRVDGVLSLDHRTDSDRQRLTVRVGADSPFGSADLVRLLGDIRLGAVTERGPSLEDAYVALVESRA
jgi:ABC-2 type transport system ATP-binding protein